MADIERGDLRALNLVASADVAALEAAIGGWGWALWRLGGAGVSDAASFFAQAARDLPAPFTTRAVRDWDAFADSAWEAAALTDADAIAFLWTDVHRMLEGGLGDLLAASTALVTLVRQLANPSSPDATPRALYVFLAGDGPNFPPRVF
jgi:hypothetical protein